MITGFFVAGLFPQPFVQVAIRIPEFRPEWVLVPFVVDTGASNTCLHAFDAARRLGLGREQLDPAAWDDRVAMAGLGGSVQYREVAAELGFQDDTGTWTRMHHLLRLGDWTSSELPSLLGCDVLANFRLLVDHMQTVSLEF